MKIAFLGFPAIGGNYTSFCYLKDGLKNVLINLISLGATSTVALPEENFVWLGKNLDRKKDINKLAKLFLKYVEDQKIDIVIPMNSAIVVSVIPFLPPNCKVVQIVNSDTPRVYKYVTSHLEYVSRIVCISKKQIDIIQKRVEPIFFEENVSLIPHGVEVVQDDVAINLNNTLCIGYIGRMHQGHKNIFIIPEILKSLKFPYVLELIGEGEDREVLIQKLDKHKIKYTDVGQIERNNINSYIKKWDIKLFPSTVEGFGLTLIECMNNGVVPLSNLLTGITDYIITDQKDGFIIPENNIKKYIHTLQRLNSDRELLNKMKNNAKETVQERFDLELIIQQYQKLFQDVYETPKNVIILNFSKWKPYVEYKPSVLERIKLKVFRLTK